MYTERCIGSLHHLYHHDILGQKWGIRRSPEQLGHTSSKTVEKSSGNAIVKNEHYVSAEKGISVHEKKLKGYCLKPGAKHSKDFFDAGYTENDADRLFHDLAEHFDLSKAIDKQYDNISNHTTVSIPMTLGTDKRRIFRTIWRDDGMDSTYRFITAYVDRKLKEDD